MSEIIKSSETEGSHQRNKEQKYIRKQQGARRRGLTVTEHLNRHKDAVLAEKGAETGSLERDFGKPSY